MPRAAPLLCLLTAAAAAQGPELVVLLRDPSGKPVPGARGLLRGRSAPILPAIESLGPWAHGRDRRDGWLAGSSDERGVLRFAGTQGDDTPGAASGIVWTDDGLGALVVDLYAGRAQRLALQPMAELTTADGSAPLSVHARAHLPGGGTVQPFLADAAGVRLPAGDYELWVRRGDTWTWQRRTLRSGQRTVVPFDGPVVHLAPDDATSWVYPAGRPDVLLATGANGCSLHGDAARAPLLALRDGVVHGPVVADPAPDGAFAWPDRAAHAATTVALDFPPGFGRMVQVWSLRRTATGTWHVLGVARTVRSPSASQRPEPYVRLPVPPDGDVWLLWRADGFAPAARPWTDAPARPPLAIERGVPLAVACRDENGLPLVDVAVDYVPDRMEPATVAAATDAFGTARLGPVLGPGLLRISDARYANRTIALQTIPLEPLEVTVDEGDVLHGVARWPDGAPATGVVVTLRDPSGALRPAERAVIAGDDGAFAFPGLTANRGLVLFASTKRDGRTWSGKLDRLLPGGGTVELVVRDEDPQLLPR